MADNGSGVADAKTFDTMVDPVSSFEGGAITCPVPLNAGAHTYELRAAIEALERWVSQRKGSATVSAASTWQARPGS